MMKGITMSDYGGKDEIEKSVHNAKHWGGTSHKAYAKLEDSLDESDSYDE